MVLRVVAVLSCRLSISAKARKLRCGILRVTCARLGTTRVVQLTILPLTTRQHCSSENGEACHVRKFSYVMLSNLYHTEVNLVVPLVIDALLSLAVTLTPMFTQMGHLSIRVPELSRLAQLEAFPDYI